MPQEESSLFSRVGRILTMDVAAGLKARIVPGDSRVRSAILRILTKELWSERKKTEMFVPTPENKKKFLRQLALVLPIVFLTMIGISWLTRQSKILPACDSMELARWHLISLTFLPTIMAAFTLPKALRMLNAPQWPLPDAAVLHPTRLIKGKALKQCAAWLLAFCCFCIPFPLYAYFLLQQGAGFIYDGSAKQRCLDAEAKKTPRHQTNHEQNH